MKIAKTSRGFTIVELLIVIAVIAILAAISVVAFTGIQARAHFSSMQSDLRVINNAIQMYHTENGRYPIPANPSTGNAANGGNITGRSLNITGLVPDYISSIPSMHDDGKGGYYAYIWTSNGANYKLVRLTLTGVALPAPEQNLPNADQSRPGRGWGYWSSGGVNI